jgi:hypothetical protein
MFGLCVGLHTITRGDLERAAARGQKVNTVVLGWTHVSRGVSPELARQALGKVITVGPQTGLSRLGRRCTRLAHVRREPHHR